MELEDKYLYILRRIDDGTFVGKSHIEVTDQNGKQIVCEIDDLEENRYIVTGIEQNNTHGIGARIIKRLTEKGKQILKEN